jgi:hypothetical protein
MICRARSFPDIKIDIMENTTHRAWRQERVGRAAYSTLLVCVSLFLNMTPVIAQETGKADRSQAPAFQPGESYRYMISWLGIPVGSATMEITDSPPTEQQPTLRLVTTAVSNPFLSKFFPVKNRVESIVDAQSFLPFEMVFQRREGKRHDDIEITFHRQERKASVTKNGKTSINPIPENIHDALSCLYFLRRQPSLDPGTSYFIDIFHDKKQYKVEAKIEKLQSIKGPWGTVPALRVLVIMPFQGIFLNEGNIQVWLTNDQEHTPLMMKAKVTIGSVKAVFQPSSPS